jgi:hypothetical protein
MIHNTPTVLPVKDDPGHEELTIHGLNRTRLSA